MIDPTRLHDQHYAAFCISSLEEDPEKEEEEEDPSPMADLLRRLRHESLRAWPVPPLEEKVRLVRQLVFRDLSLVRKTLHSPKLSEDAAPTKTLSPIQIGLTLFFSLLKSVQSTARPQQWRAVLQPLPHFLLQMQPLALAKDSPDSDTLEDSVVISLFNAMQYFVTLSKEPSTNNTHTALTAMIGLSIKSGLLHLLLNTVKLLFIHHSSTPLENVQPFLNEIVHATALIEENTPVDEEKIGYLVSFGKGDHGKLGHGCCSHPGCSDGKCTENKFIPTPVDSISDIPLRKIDSLSTHSVAITTSGRVLSWGNGDKNRLGHGDTNKEYSPKFIDFFQGKPQVKDVACGLGHTLALLANGKVYSWGNGGNGRLGLGDTTDMPTASHIVNLDSCDIVKLFSGASHSMALSKCGRVYTWGKNNQGQCGHGNTHDQLIPLEITKFENEEENEDVFYGDGDSSDERKIIVSQVAGGWEHSLLRSDTGKIYSFGSGYKDSRRAGIPPVLGHGNVERQLFPRVISSLLDVKISHVACGWDHSLAVSSEGKLYTWGAGTNGKLGHGNEDNKVLPCLVSSVGNKFIVHAQGGCEHSAAITKDGELYTWGHGDCGRLGHGDSTSKKTPTLVESLSWQDLSPVAIAVGDKYNLVLVQSESHDKPKNKDCINSNKNACLPKSKMFDTSWMLSKIPALYACTDVDNEIAEGNNLFDSSSVALIIIAHLNRLAACYMTESETEVHLELRNVYHFQNMNCIKKEIDSSSQPYAVDCSIDSFVAILQILSGFIDESKSEIDSNKAEKTGLLQAGYLAEAVQNLKSEKPHEFDSGSNKKVSPELLRFIAMLSTLGILKANLFHLIKWKKFFSEECDVSIDKRKCEESKIANISSTEIGSSSQPSFSDVFEKLHVLLLHMAKNDIYCPNEDFYMGCGFKDRVEMSLANQAIKLEVAAVMQTGVFLFYPQEVQRRKLFLEILSFKNEEELFKIAMINVFCQDYILAEILLDVFSNTNRGHDCSSNQFDSIVVDLNIPLEVPVGINYISPVFLTKMVIYFLNQCYENNVSHAKSIFNVLGNAENCNNKSCNNTVVESYLKLLVCLHTQIFSLWMEEASSCNKKCEITHSCLSSCAFIYIKRVFVIVKQFFVTLLDEENISALRFIDVFAVDSKISLVFNLFPLVIHSLCAVPRAPFVLIFEILPLLISNLRAFNEINSALKAIDEQLLYSEDLQNFREIQESCGLLCGRYINELISGREIKDFSKSLNVNNLLNFPIVSGGFLNEDSYMNATSSDDSKTFFGKIDQYPFYQASKWIELHMIKEYAPKNSVFENIFDIDWSDLEKQAHSFLLSFLNGDEDAQVFHQWMLYSINRGSSSTKKNDALAIFSKVTIATLALILWQNNLSIEVLKYFQTLNLELLQSSTVDFSKLSKKPLPPHPTLCKVWQTVDEIELSLESLLKDCNADLLISKSETIVKNIEILLQTRPTGNSAIALEESSLKFKNWLCSCFIIVYLIIFEDLLSVMFLISRGSDTLDCEYYSSSIVQKVAQLWGDSEKQHLSRSKEFSKHSLYIPNHCVQIEPVTVSELINLLVLPIDLHELWEELSIRKLCGELRVLGFNIINELLTALIFPPVVSEVIRTFSDQSYSNQQNLSLKNFTYDLNGIGLNAMHSVINSLLSTYSTLARILKEPESPLRLQKNILNTWTVELHNVMFPVSSDLIPFLVICKSNIISILGHHFANQGDILNCLDGMGCVFIKNWKTFSPKNSQVCIIQSILNDCPEKLAFHHICWYLFRILSNQLCSKVPFELIDGNSKKSPRSRIPLSNSKPLHIKSIASEPAFLNTVEEVFLVLLTELSRVQNELNRSNSLFESISEINSKTNVFPLISASPFIFSNSSTGKFFQESRSRSQTQFANGFSICLWLYIANEENPKAKTNDSGYLEKFLLFSKKNMEDTHNKKIDFIQYCPTICLIKSSCRGYQLEFKVDRHQNCHTQLGVCLTSPEITELGWLYVSCVYSASTSQIQVFVNGSLQTEMKIDPIIETDCSSHIVSVGGLVNEAVDASKYKDIQDRRNICNGIFGVIDDLYWYDDALLTTEIEVLYSAGTNLYRLKKRFLTDQCCFRIVQFVRELLFHSTSGSGFLSSSRWTSLLLSSLRCSSPKAKKEIFMLFQEVLVLIQPEFLLAPMLSNSTETKIAYGSAMKAAAIGRGPNGVLEFLTQTLGLMWWKYWPCTKSVMVNQHGFCIDKNNPYFIALLNKGESVISSGGEDLAKSIFSETNYLYENEFHNNGDSYSQSEVVEMIKLLRILLKASQWRTSLVNRFQNALVQLPQLVLTKRPISDLKNNNFTLQEIASDLYETITAIYTIGGFKNFINCGVDANFNFNSRIKMFFDYGTVKTFLHSKAVVEVGCRSNLNESKKLNKQQIQIDFQELKPLCSNYPDPKIFPFTQSLVPTCSFILSQENIPFLGNHPQSTTGRSSNKDDLKNEVQLDNKIAVYAHLRSKFIFALQNIFKNIESAKTFMESNDGQLWKDLLCLSSTDIVLAAELALGDDKERAMQLVSYAALLSNLRQGTFTEEELEVLASKLWKRLPLAAASVTSPWWNTSPRKKLEILNFGGQVEIDGLKVKGLQHFASVRLSGVSVGVGSGAWFYEVMLLTDGLMQIGWADALFMGDALEGQGVGDHAHSWAFDGFRSKRWNGTSDDYGERWQAGDVIGVLLDMNAKEMYFTLNGRQLGPAFVNFSSHDLFPAVSFNVGQSLHFNFGSDNVPFMHPPPAETENGTHVRPVAEMNLCRSPQSYDSENTKSETENSDLISHSDVGIANMTLNDSSATPRDFGSSYQDEDAEDVKYSSHEVERGGDSMREDEIYRRNQLLQTLVGMGFPNEWAVRYIRDAKDSSSMNDEHGGDNDISESKAIAWIIEQMEREALKMEEIRSTRNTPMNINDGFDEDGGDEDEDLDEDDDDDADIVGEEAEENDENLIFNSQMKNRAYLLNNDVLDNIDLDSINSIENTTFMSQSGSNQPILPKSNSAKTSCVSIKNNSIRKENNRSKLINNPYLIEEENEDVSNDVLFSTWAADKESFSLSIDKKSNLIGLGNIAAEEEVWVLYVVVEIALSILYARRAVFSLISTNAPEYVQIDSEEVIENNSMPVPDLYGSVSQYSKKANAATLLVKVFHFFFFHESIEKSRMYGWLDTKLSFADNLYQNYTADVKYFNGLKRTQSALWAIVSSDYLQNQFCHSTDQQSSFTSCLVEEVLDNFTRARSMEFISTTWGNYSCVSRASLLQSDGDVLSKPNIEWSSWIFHTILDFANNEIVTSFTFNKIDEKQSKVENPGPSQNTGQFPCYNIRVYLSLIHAARSGNICLRKYIFRCLCHLLRDMLCHLNHLRNNKLPIKVMLQWYSNEVEEYINASQFDSLKQVFAVRFQKETLNLGAKVLSQYIQSLFMFLVMVARLKEFLESVKDIEIRNKTESPVNVVVDLSVDEISSNHITLSWGFWTALSLPTMHIDHIKKYTLFYKAESDSNYLCDQEILPKTESGYYNYSLMGLIPDTVYNVYVSTDNSNEFSNEPAVNSIEKSREINVKTPCETVFMLDPNNIGTHLELINSNMSALNTCNKKWNAVRATKGFSCGSHYWEVHIDKCISKNIFIGIVDASANFQNYVGCDTHGWGYLANKALWHAKGKIKNYGEIYKQGDTIGVSLNMDQGTLSFARNRKDLGIAIDGLKGKYFPAFSMYNKDDQVTFIPSSASQSLRNIDLGGASSQEKVTAMLHINAIKDCVKSNYDKLPQNFPKDLLAIIVDKWIGWKKSAIRRYLSVKGDYVDLNVSSEACNRFGFNSGDMILSSKGICTIIGVCQYCLWYTFEGNCLVNSWNLRTCREMLLNPVEYPVTKHPSNEDGASCSDCEKISLDLSENCELCMNSLLSQWNKDMDCKVVSFVNDLINESNTLSPCDIKFEEISELIIKNFNGEMFDCNRNEIELVRKVTTRISFILCFNDLLNEVFPLINNIRYSLAYHSTHFFEDLLPSLSHMIFAVNKKKLLTNFLSDTQTLTRTTSSDTYDDPPEIVRVTLSPRHLSNSAIPFWDKSLVSFQEYKCISHNSCFTEICSQLRNVDSKEFRRHFVGSSGIFYERQIRTLSFSNDGSSVFSDQTSAYKDVFYSIFTEVQSEICPLFILPPNALREPEFFVCNKDKVKLTLNMSLGLHGFESKDSASGVFSELIYEPSIILLYYQFGQFLGMALRANMRLPLQLSAHVWKTLVSEPLAWSDLNDIDSSSAFVINFLENEELLTAEKFSNIFPSLAYTCRLSNGMKVELQPRGSEKLVNFQDRKKYASMLLEMRLSEGKKQLLALKDGFYSIVPEVTSSLLTSCELEMLICSSYSFGVRAMKDLTIYDSAINQHDDYISKFWDILFALSSEDQLLLYCFLTRQVRKEIKRMHSFVLRICSPLPNMIHNPDDCYLIVNKSDSNDRGFDLHLPKYSTKEIMHKKILVSIANYQCT